MKLTKHAQERSRQRGFTGMYISLIEQFGRTEKVSGGAMKIFFGKKESEQARCELKKVLQLLDKVNGSALIVDGESILTMYKI